jgi:hypothetical protein
MSYNIIILNSITKRNKPVELVWAKDALDKPISNCSIPYTDFKPFIIKYILKRWQDSWDQQIAPNTFPSWQDFLFLRFVNKSYKWLTL